MKKFLLNLLMIISITSANAETNIIGGVSTENSALSAVIQTNGSVNMCSATLIAPNVLLTAAHCVRYGSILNPPAKAGDPFEIKMQDGKTREKKSIVKISSIPIPSSFQTQKEAENWSYPAHDIALIFFKDTQCDKSIFKNISPIPIANMQIAPNLSDDVLIAGYGMINMYGESRFCDGTTYHFPFSDVDLLGKLYHGNTRWLKRNYGTKPTPFEFTDLTNEKQIITPSFFDQEWQFKDENFKKADLASVAVVEMQQDLVCPAGINSSNYYCRLKKENTEIMNFSQSCKVIGGTITNSGDSGGPAIAFDQNKNPYLVGVASTSAAPRHSSQIGILNTLFNTSGKIISEGNSTMELPTVYGLSKNVVGFGDIPKPYYDDMHFYLDSYINQTLLNLEIKDNTNNILKNYEIHFKRQHVIPFHHTSVLNSENYEFIIKNLKEFELERVMQNYCQ